jgi:methyl-accepting chemotaxis protein
MGKIRNKLLLAFILVSLIPLIALGGYALTSISKSLKDVSTGKLQDRVGLISFEIEDFLKNVSNDLFYLRDSVLLRDMVRDIATADTADLETMRNKLEQDFLAFSKHKKIYHQVRFLDADGMEVVRVDRVRGESLIVPRERLQNKKKRYYFADTAKLPKGELMISPLDLNREHGQVEKPLRPVIRYGTPVYDDNGQLRGIVLFNVMAETFLDLVRKKNTGSEQALFIDSKGYYYVHPDRAKEWGRKTDLAHGASFGEDYPEVAGQVVGARAPATVDQDNYLIAVSPVFLDKGRTSLLGDIVDIVPAEVVFAPALTFRNIFLAISAGVFLFTLILALNLAKSITEPIVYLTRITHDMSKGKLATPVSVTSRDETRLLAESVERLRKSMVILLKRMKKK